MDRYKNKPVRPRLLLRRCVTRALPMNCIVAAVWWGRIISIGWWMVEGKPIHANIEHKSIGSIQRAQETDESCHEFRADCNGCLAKGCFWCPEDATCWSSNVHSGFLLDSCTKPSDFETASCVQPGNVFDDPEYSGQAWVYDMINVEPVWEMGIFGKGIRVRVNDNGVDADHPEFSGRFDAGASCSVYRPLPPEDDRSSVPPFHGTSVAAILGAGANNGACSVGIAPEVSISSCYAFSGVDFLAYKLDQFDISQNSFGNAGCRASVRRRQLQENCPFLADFSDVYPCTRCNFASINEDCEATIVDHCQRYYEEDFRACSSFLDIILGGKCNYVSIPQDQREDILTGITEGRDGKGVVYLFSSGNAFQQGDDTNISTYTNSRFFISVGAVGKDSLHASYSTPGASLFVSAPGGDFESPSNHVTAGLNGVCQDSGFGTSFACPVVSGVVALMLEANPDLTWRDVQDILARTSQAVEDIDDDTAFINAAGIWHSNFYGFGIVDAFAAVGAAENATLLTTEKLLIGDSGILNAEISDNSGAPVVSSLSVQSSGDVFVLESVEVELDLEYMDRGHLQIVLVSPGGTKSVLHPGNRPENKVLPANERWKLLTLRNWGENPNGEWTLSIVDTKEGSVEDCQNGSWSMVWGDGSTVDCGTIERRLWCIDGKKDPTSLLDQESADAIFGTVANGLLAEEACCACRARKPSGHSSHRLIRWRLAMYGSENDVLDRDASPTTVRIPPVPIDAPNQSPMVPIPILSSQEPSQEPTLFASKLPTNIPSLLASQVPSDPPSSTPSSIAPSFLPSPSPSSFPSERFPSVFVLTMETPEPSVPTRMNPTPDRRPDRPPEVNVSTPAPTVSPQGETTSPDSVAPTPEATTFPVREPSSEEASPKPLSPSNEPTTAPIVATPGPVEAIETTLAPSQPASFQPSALAESPQQASAAPTPIPEATIGSTIPTAPATPYGTAGNATRVVALEFQGVRLRLEGVALLSSTSVAAFERATASFYNGLYQQTTTSALPLVRRRRSLLLAGTDLEGFNTRVEVQKQEPTATGNTITYDQRVSFSTFAEAKDTGPGEVAGLLVEAFASTERTEAYLSQLKALDSKGFAGATGVVFPAPPPEDGDEMTPTAAEEQPPGVEAPPMFSPGAIAGIAVGSVVVLVCCIGIYEEKRDVDDREEHDDDEGPNDPHRAQRFPLSQKGGGEGGFSLESGSGRFSDPRYPLVLAAPSVFGSGTEVSPLVEEGVSEALGRGYRYGEEEDDESLLPPNSPARSDQALPEEPGGFRRREGDAYSRRLGGTSVPLDEPYELSRRRRTSSSGKLRRKANRGRWRTYANELRLRSPPRKRRSPPRSLREPYELAKDPEIPEPPLPHDGCPEDEDSQTTTETPLAVLARPNPFRDEPCDEPAAATIQHETPPPPPQPTNDPKGPPTAPTLDLRPAWRNKEETIEFQYDSDAFSDASSTVAGSRGTTTTTSKEDLSARSNHHHNAGTQPRAPIDDFHDEARPPSSSSAKLGSFGERLRL